MRDKIILILLFLPFTLDSSIAQVNTATSIDKIDYETDAAIIEDFIVGEKLEQIQSESNIKGNTIEDLR